ncbi:MAG: putative transposase [Gammaproteobacteria bacterium]|jgi:putative transposase
MEQQKVRRHRTAREWETVLAEQASSGLSQKAYCQRHGITLSGFYNARSRLKSKAGSLVPSPDAPAEFIDISLDALPAPAPTRHWDVELSLGEGVMLRIRRSAGKD